MPLARLTLNNFRCFNQVAVTFSSGCNLVSGDNATGKTSLLEAVFFLSRGRSFRTPKIPSLLQSGKSEFEVVAKIESAQGAPFPLGKRYNGAVVETHLAGAVPSTLATVSAAFPVLLFDAGAHRLIDGSPSHRRRFLDWGVFHVEPPFLACWRDYRRVLRQRNILLRSAPNSMELAGWDKTLAGLGVELDVFRRRYVEDLSGILPELVAPVFGDHAVELEYKSGWSNEYALEEALRVSRGRDVQLGSTQSGPHRAELLIKLDGAMAQQLVSRGQQKILSGMMTLAQAQLYQDMTGKNCTFLLDDLAAELDPRFLAIFLEQLWRTGSQSIITTINPTLLAGAMPTGSAMFHVEHGVLRRVDEKQ